MWDCHQILSQCSQWSLMTRGKYLWLTGHTLVTRAKGQDQENMTFGSLQSRLSKFVLKRLIFCVWSMLQFTKNLAGLSTSETQELLQVFVHLQSFQVKMQMCEIPSSNRNSFSNGMFTSNIDTKPKHQTREIFKTDLSCCKDVKKTGWTFPELRLVRQAQLCPPIGWWMMKSPGTGVEIRDVKDLRFWNYPCFIINGMRVWQVGTWKPHQGTKAHLWAEQMSWHISDQYLPISIKLVTRVNMSQWCHCDSP